MDELHLEEVSLRMTQEKMDDAFCAAMQRAIDAGAGEYTHCRFEEAWH